MLFRKPRFYGREDKIAGTVAVEAFDPHLVKVWNDAGGSRSVSGGAGAGGDG